MAVLEKGNDVKMKMSDTIENFIRELFEDEQSIELKRNELASYFNCVPSQINYVISTRFTTERGYIVESRRGGGGYIRIKRVVLNSSSAFMHIINSIGDSIDSMTTRIVIENCLEAGLISKDTARIMAAAVSNTVMQSVPPVLKDMLRATILKQMLLTQI